jgi:hypothetical protein
VILSGCDIGAGARLRRVILDKNCKIEPGTVTIGYDPEADRARLPFVTESGIAVFPKGTVVPARGPVVLANDVAELIANDPELRASSPRAPSRWRCTAGTATTRRAAVPALRRAHPARAGRARSLRVRRYPALFDRDGGLYGPGGASEFGDNQIRFGALGKAAVAAGPQLFGGTAPDVLHVHDWQGGPAAIFSRAAQAPSTIVATIHNLAYRGIFPKSAIDELGIPWSMFSIKVLEFYDQVCFLKGALGVADAVTTVSPTYAKEILTPERGEVLDGFLRWDVRRLVGIVNGIDTLAWDPANDKAIAAGFSRAAPKAKALCREALAKEVGLPLVDREPLIGWSRG